MFGIRCLTRGAEAKGGWMFVSAMTDCRSTKPLQPSIRGFVGEETCVRRRSGLHNDR